MNRAVLVKLRRLMDDLAFSVPKEHELDKMEDIALSMYAAIRDRRMDDSRQDVDCEIMLETACCLAQIAEERQSRKQWRKAIALFHKSFELGELPKVFTLERGRSFTINQFLNNSYYNLGICYEQVGDMERSIHFLENAIEADGGDTSALFNLGMFLAREGRFEDAISRFVCFLQLEPMGEDSDIVRRALAQARKHTKR